MFGLGCYIFTQLNSILSHVYKKSVGIKSSTERMINLLSIALDDVNFNWIRGLDNIAKSLSQKLFTIEFFINLKQATLLFS